MINKIFKKLPILNSYLRFLFLIRYLLLLILFSAVVFVISPKFFNYDKRIGEINNVLNEKYKIKIQDYSKIKYTIFPSSGLIIKKSKLNINNNLVETYAEEIFLNVGIKNLYEKNLIQIKKLNLKNSLLRLNYQKYNSFFNYLSSIKNILSIQQSNFELFIEDKNLIEIKNFSFLNDKSNNKFVNGEYLEQKIKVKFLRKLKNNNLNIKIKDIGFNANITFPNNIELKDLKGNTQISILDNKLSFDFMLNDELKIFNSNFRNKILTTSFDGKIKYNPFLNLDLILNVRKFDKKVIFTDKINILENDDILKKINGNFKINFSNKNFLKNNLINQILLNISLINGLLVIEPSNIIFAGGETSISGSISDYNNIKKFVFDINLNLKDVKKLFKKLNIKIKNKKKLDKLININGSLFLNSNKIKINHIKIDNQKIGTEKLKFYQDNFQKIVIRNTFLNILNINELKKFIQTLS